jgi:hypothetical protein
MDGIVVEDHIWISMPACDFALDRGDETDELAHIDRLRPF